MARTRTTRRPRKALPPQGPPPQGLSQPRDKVEQPDPANLAGLKKGVLSARQQFSQAKRESKGTLAVALAALKYLVARLNAFRLMRVWQLYNLRRGPLMAAGISYNMFFSLAALLVAGFSIFGLVLAGNVGLERSVVNTLARTVPGLIDTGSGGLAKPRVLFQSQALSWTLAVSTFVLLITALGFIASLRAGMRAMFDLEPVRTNPLLLKLKDLGTLLILAVALLLATGVAAVSQAALNTVLDLLHLQGTLAGPATQAAGIPVMLLLDMVIALVMFRMASAIRMPRAEAWQSTLIAGAGSTVLRIFSTMLLGSVTRNPLLAPFAVILGLFVWFFLLGQVYLFAAAWGAVGTADARAHRKAAGNARREPSLRQRAREQGTA